MPTTCQQVRNDAAAIIELLTNAINAIKPALRPDPEAPVERVLQGDQRYAGLCGSMLALGSALSRTGYGDRVAKGLVASVRVIRGDRAETLYDMPYIRTKNVFVQSSPDHVEVVCDEVQRKKDYA